MVNINKLKGKIVDYVCVLKTDERGEIVLTWVKKN